MASQAGVAEGTPAAPAFPSVSAGRVEAGFVRPLLERGVQAGVSPGWSACFPIVKCGIQGWPPDSWLKPFGCSLGQA